MLKVLLVEDHRSLAATICDFLEAHDMVVDYAQNCNLAQQLLKTETYNVLILDINLPDGDGYELCDFIRNKLGLSTPIIMLTARDARDDRLRGFEVGTDDYLVKPFDMLELVMRIKAFDKRSQGLVGNLVLNVGDLMLDVKKGIAKRQDKELELSPIGFKILGLLMRRSPNIIKRSDIEMHVWGDELPSSDSLRSHIYSLRKIVDKPFKKQLIQTVTGRGIKIDAD